MALRDLTPVEQIKRLNRAGGVNMEYGVRRQESGEKAHGHVFETGGKGEKGRLFVIRGDCQYRTQLFFDQSTYL
jgi:hypothetical protein